MGMVLGIVVFVLFLAITVGWHELGHLIPAKLFGVKVRQYMIGFGPTLWSTTKGETEYGIKGIPLGGYIRMMGMYRPTPSTTKPGGRGWAASVIREARELSAEEIGSDDPKRAFFSLSWPKKLVVMLGGPTMNLILALIVLVIVVCGIGVAVPTTTVKSVSTCVTSSGSSQCSSADPAAPAKAAGIEPGDTIVQWGGQDVSSWDQLTAAIRAGGSNPVQVVVDRNGQEMTLTVDPVVVQREVTNSDGTVKKDADGNAETQDVPVVGITPTSQLQGQPISEVGTQFKLMISGTIGVIVKLPQELWSVVSEMINGQPRDASSPMGIVGVARLTGDVGSYVSEIGWAGVISNWLSILASLNIALWAFNLLPLLPLDGGHVLGALWEALRKGWAKLRRQPSPGAADTARMMPFAYVVIGVFAVMTVVLVVADIVNPVTLG